MKRRFVLLDRDGTIIEKHSYLADPELVMLLPTTVDGLRTLRNLGLGLAVITNQSGVNRGYFTGKTLDAIHERMSELLAESQVFLDGIYACPHRPDEKCGCRKPCDGLVEQAARDLSFEPSECFVIGDDVCDIELGRRIGATTILVCTGRGIEVEYMANLRPDHVVDHLADAASLITRSIGK